MYVCMYICLLYKVVVLFVIPERSIADEHHGHCLALDEHHHDSELIFGSK
jgi:hypothetical protein